MTRNSILTKSYLKRAMQDAQANLSSKEPWAALLLVQTEEGEVWDYPLSKLAETSDKRILTFGLMHHMFDLCNPPIVSALLIAEGRHFMDITMRGKKHTQGTNEGVILAAGRSRNATSYCFAKAQFHCKGAQPVVDPASFVYDARRHNKIEAFDLIDLFWEGITG